MKEPTDHLEVQAPAIPDHRLLRPIGEGSSGQVWLARNVMGEYRAVKVIRRPSEGPDSAFRREFDGLRRFEPVSRGHPGVVSILHVGKDSSDLYFYYVMELADDRTSARRIVPETYKPRTLRSEILMRGRLPSTECLEIGLTLARGLAHLHGHGLVHRDVKPSNVIFVDGAPKLADIGLVGLEGEGRSFVGTEGFVSPEGPGNARSDIYSLGKLFYEMATGKDALLDYPALPSDFGIEPAMRQLNRLILQACEPAPDRRIPDAHALEKALLSVQAGKRLPMRRRHWLRAAAMATGAAAAAGISATALWRRTRTGSGKQLTGVLLQTLPLPVAPRRGAAKFAFAWDEPMNRVFMPICNRPGGVVVIRFGAEIAIEAVLSTPDSTSVDLTPDGSRLYARAHWGLENLGAIAYDASDLHVIGEYHGPEVTWTVLASAASPTIVYMDQCNDPGAVAKIDFSTGSILKTIAVGAWPATMTFGPGRRMLYVAHGQAGREMNPKHRDPVGISVIDIETDTVIRTLRVNGEPSMSLRVTSDGQHLFFTTRNMGGERLYKVAVPECQVLGTLDLPGLGEPAIALSLDGQFAFVPHTDRNLVYVIDAHTLQRVGLFRIPSPDNICPAPDGRHALAMSSRASCLYWMELRSHSA